MALDAPNRSEVVRVRVAETDLTAVEGDLTAQDVDAIVNAANTSLLHGGGVAGAIARRGGTVIQDESDAWRRRNGKLQRGQAAVTAAGALAARNVVHVAGPVYQGTADDEPQLREAVRAALDAAADTGAASVALPAISAGIYGYPLDAATRTIVDEAASWARANGGRLAEIRFVALGDDARRRFEAAMKDLVE